MTSEEALKLVPGDRVALGDEGIPTRIVTKGKDGLTVL
jgi:hypothetical protein